MLEEQLKDTGLDYRIGVSEVKECLHRYIESLKQVLEGSTVEYLSLDNTIKNYSTLLCHTYTNKTA